MSPSSRTIDPRQHCLLSNGKLSVMLSANGSGYTRWRDLAVTRWREDPVSDPWGSYLLLRDEDSGEVWSLTQQPGASRTPDDAVEFGIGHARFSRRHHSVHSELEVAVASDSDTELRRVTLSNHGDRTRMLTLTSYAELVLGTAATDDAHPAFSKMFVQTEWDAARGLLLAHRRARDAAPPAAWCAQALQIEGQRADGVSFETDRARFLGRGRTLARAQAMAPGAALSGTVGCVLDPVFALRQSLTLVPRGSVTLLLWTTLSDTREGALALAARLTEAGAAAALFDGAARQAEAERARHGIDTACAARCAQWLSALLVADTAQRAPVDQLPRGRGGPPTLWAAGISGDRPIALLYVRGTDTLVRVRELLQAQAWWRSQRLAVDVVLLDTAAGDSALQQALTPLVEAQQARLAVDDGGPKAQLFVLQDDTLATELRQGLLTVARLVLDAAEPVPHMPDAPAAAVAAPPIRASTPAAPPAAASAERSEFANGSGAFVDDGRAYRIDLDDGRTTPAPWVNVIANPAFGFLVSAEGGGYAWSLNSQQNPLTPWPNDPVSDMPHDVIYLRDQDTGDVWSATALPIRVPGAHYTATHGKGWSRFRSDAHGIEADLVQCVPLADPVKLSRLRLCNHSARTRQLSVTGYVQWALGANGSTPAPFVITAHDEATGAMLARNPWRPDFGERVAFFDMAGQQQSISGDRREFLGELGTVEHPAALHDGAPLAGRVGAGLDPCGALQTRIELPPHTQVDLLFLLGDASAEAEAQTLIDRYRRIDIDDVLVAVAAQWSDVLDAVQVRTPDRALDILLNDWLLYQVLACRLWARTAYYQASGAYGFRDQLQDVMALCVSRPDVAREQLLRAAGRQFAEGDVQHWWLPPQGQGIRTRISDDRLWLVYVAMHYVRVSGDDAVLDEALPWLTGPAIEDGATDAFFLPGHNDDVASLYEHTARAIDSSLAIGAHGLPLIGTGDWNDGMNAVGAAGRGESSWLAWFLLAAIAALAPVAEQRGDGERARRWRDHADTLRQALAQAWDGAWYRRGYYDDGTPLGSAQNDECRIDTIAQSWSVMASAGDPATIDRERATQAMASVDRLLVDHTDQVAKLFTPPFDGGPQNPGYIKGYPPGVRENGGQYTHGAIWSIFAWAGLGDGDRAGDLFSLLNPIHHSASAEAVQRYKVEPYVVCADVYAEPPLVGRGGWTWYTGSAAWLYRAGLEALLGFQLRGEQLRIDPCMPKHWPGFTLTYRHRGKQHVSCYEVSVENPQRVCRGVRAMEMDGQTLDAGKAVALVDDGRVHRLRVTLGAKTPLPLGGED
ncbi:GH36-type glycosyl hydrolase domain-containing protein [Rhodanobacter ginsenosidimutans]|uniref:GH36-type glycosyl hydrolase domain-containing protein n=1 Tax=Rhodanobacter ginsenosidimutans TaxID=490571 RepID=A0ABW0K021_9GAMM